MPDKPGNVLRKVEAIDSAVEAMAAEMRARSGILEALHSELLTLTERIRERWTAPANVVEVAV
jgi:hypothetical protein